MKDLMTPRYLVIADYPNMINDQLGLGDIIPITHPNKYVEEKSIKEFDKYPHLFRKLHWSEHLTEDEIPLYVKHIKNGKVYKVRKFHKTDMKAYDENWKFINLKLYLPSNESEYTTYKTKPQ